MQHIISKTLVDNLITTTEHTFCQNTFFPLLLGSGNGERTQRSHLTKEQDRAVMTLPSLPTWHGGGACQAPLHIGGMNEEVDGEMKCTRKKKEGPLVFPSLTRRGPAKEECSYFSRGTDWPSQS